jgi:hypothetical protein
MWALAHACSTLQADRWEQPATFLRDHRTPLQSPGSLKSSSTGAQAAMATWFVLAWKAATICHGWPAQPFHGPRGTRKVI